MTSRAGLEAVHVLILLKYDLGDLFILTDFRPDVPSLVNSSSREG